MFDDVMKQWWDEKNNFQKERIKEKRGEELERAKLWRSQLLLDDIRDELRRIANALENLRR